MDTKLTLSFNEEVVKKAKIYAANNNISLSRLIEHLLIQVTEKPYQSLEEFPIADWVSMVAEGEVEYKTTSKKERKANKDEFFAAKK
ncbi:DUF6364 family protein [Pedobacter insulae]|nr:DUF6364 family protein [Pedobacter insulae]